MSSNIDYFSRLPSELTQRIVDYYDTLAPNVPFPALSKRHLHLHERSLWKSVKIKDCERFERFINKVVTVEYIGPLVRCLEISLEPFDHLIETVPSEFSLPTESITRMFDKLSRITRLRLENCDFIAEKFFDHGSAGRDTLQELEIVASHSSMLLRVDGLLRISRFQRLSNLTLMSDPYTESFEYGTPPNAFVALPSLERLNLAGLLSILPGVAYFLRSIVPTEVYLTDFSDWSDMHKLLDCFTSPEKIHTLSIDTGSYYLNDLGALLHRFTSLANLELHGGYSSPKPDFYRLLRQIPLKSPTFGRGTKVNVRELNEAFFQAGSKPPHLTSLVLNNAGYEEGGGWKLRTEVREVEDVEDLIDAAEVNSVQLTGTTIELLQMERDQY